MMLVLELSGVNGSGPKPRCALGACLIDGKQMIIFRPKTIVKAKTPFILHSFVGIISANGPVQSCGVSPIGRPGGVCLSDFCAA